MLRKMDSVENFCGNYLYHHSSDSFVITLTTARRRQIFQLLKNSVGLSIQQVGDIDLSYTL